MGGRKGGRSDGGGFFIMLSLVRRVFLELGIDGRDVFRFVIWKLLFRRERERFLVFWGVGVVCVKRIIFYF